MRLPKGISFSLDVYPRDMSIVCKQKGTNARKIFHFNIGEDFSLVELEECILRVEDFFKNSKKNTRQTVVTTTIIGGKKQ